MTYLEVEVLSTDVMDGFYAEQQMKDENDRPTRPLPQGQPPSTSANTDVVQLLRPLSLGYDKMHEHDVMCDMSAASHGSYFTDETALTIKAVGEVIIEGHEQKCELGH
eukprot:12114020-Heterocapsa_arctica.AAC.1